MGESMCYRRKFCLLPMLAALLAFFLLAGCGDKDMQKDNPIQENQGAQISEGQDAQKPESGGTQGDQDTQKPENGDTQGNQDAGQSEGQPTAGSQPEGQGNGSGDGQPSESQPTANSQPEGQGNGSGDGQPGLANQPKLGVEEAKEAALKHAGLTSQEVTFVKEELDYDDGVTEYEIEFVTSMAKYEYEINASDGKVLGSSQEPIEQIPANLQGQGAISVDEAKEALLNHAGFQPNQVAYIKVELEQDDGALEYEIEFYADGKEYSGKVDASTGAIMKYGVE